MGDSTLTSTLALAFDRSTLLVLAPLLVLTPEAFLGLPDRGDVHLLHPFGFVGV
jgi:hypothetical protein